MALDTVVLDVEACGLGIRGEAQSENALLVRRREHEDEVARRQSEDFADLRAPDEGRDLAAELGDVRRGEVQTFSPSRS